jgi:hypothetical protein
VRASFPVAVCRGPEQLAGLVRSHVAAALDRLFPAPDAQRASTAARPAGWEPAAGAGLWPAEYAAREVRVAAAYQEWCEAAGLPEPAASMRLLDLYCDGAGPPRCLCPAAYTPTHLTPPLAFPLLSHPCRCGAGWALCRRGGGDSRVAFGRSSSPPLPRCHRPSSPPPRRHRLLRTSSRRRGSPSAAPSSYLTAPLLRGRCVEYPAAAAARPRTLLGGHGASIRRCRITRLGAT